MVHALLANRGSTHKRSLLRLRSAGLLTVAALIVMGAFAGVAQASQITNLTVGLSPTSAAAARTVYTIGFKTTSALSAANNDRITINFPAGTGLSTIVSSTVSDAGSAVGSCSFSNTTTLTCSLGTGKTVAAGDTVSIVLGGVTNPPAGSVSMTASTTSDTTTSNPTSYTIGSAGQITAPTVSVSPPSAAAGARTVYTIGFTTSRTGGAMSNAADSRITINFPAGTGLSTIVSSTVSDAGSAVGSCSFSNTTTLTCSLGTGKTVAAGDTVSIVLGGVTNPPAGSVSMTASTTSDTTTSNPTSYTIGSAGQITAPTVSVSPPSAAAGARTVYTIGFTTSRTGGAMSNAADSRITINFPAGTGLSTIVSSTVSDAGSAVGSCSFSNTTTLTCSLGTGKTVAAGDTVSIVLGGVTNPPAGSVSMTASTTSDTTTSNPTSYTIGSAGQITAPTVSVSPPSAAAGARTVYTIGFTTSRTGGAMSNAADSRITINFPAGTGLSTIVSSTVSDAGSAVGSCSFSNTTTLTCSLGTGKTVAAGDTVSIVLGGVTNPPAGSVSMTASTTSDTTTSNPTSYTIGSAGQITAPTVSVSPPSAAAGARTVYTIGFTTSRTGGAMSNAADSRITINFPAGTGLSTIVSSTVSDAGSAVGSCSFSNTTTLTCSLGTGKTVAAGDTVSIVLGGVTNPPAGSVSMTASTTSDTTTSNPTSYTIGSAGQITAPTVMLSSFTPGGSSTYAIVFTTSSPDGAMSAAASSQITINFPAGTGLSTIVSSTVSDAGTAVGSCSFSNTTTLTCSLSTGKTVAAGDTVSIVLGGVTNPSIVSQSTTLSAFTTSDTTSATSSGYQGGGPAPPAVTGINPSSGSTAGGTNVTIAGTNLTGATAVNFGSNPATNVTVVSSTQITATSPPGSGTVDVTVTTPTGTSTTNTADQFTYNTPSSPPPSPTPPSPPPAPPSPPPAVSGGAPTTQTSSTATISGSVNPEGAPTSAFFQYGIDLSLRGPGSSTSLYDQTTPAQPVGSDSTNHTITVPLTRLVPGALYHVRLVAVSAAGTTFGQDQTFTTARAPAPPPPVLGRAENVQPVSGTVFIRLASGAFVRLTGARQIPSGAVIDALKGTLKITTALPGGTGGARDAAAKGKKPKTQSGNFGGGIFKITQARSGLANLSLVEGAFKGAPTYAGCKAHKAGEATTAALSSRTLQFLRASAHGRFRTTGRYSAATVRGTIWSVADRCDGTLTHDVTDSVVVNDFVHHKTIILRAGQSYLAKARR